MRITNPIPLLALSAGLLGPAIPAQGGMTEQMREEIRSIVREEVRAALRDLRGETRAIVRTPKADRETGRKEEEAEDRARGGFGVMIRGGDDGRGAGRSDELPAEMEALEVELERIDSLLDEIGVQLETGARELKLEALPRIELKLDADLEELRDGVRRLRSDSVLRLDGKIRIGDRVLYLSDDGVGILRKGKDDDREDVRVKLFRLDGKGTGDVEVEKTEIDETYASDGKERVFRVWVEDGEEGKVLHVDEGGKVKVFHLQEDSGAGNEDETEAGKTGDEPEKQNVKRRLVRRRTMV